MGLGARTAFVAAVGEGGRRAMEVLLDERHAVRMLLKLLEMGAVPKGKSTSQRQLGKHVPGKDRVAQLVEHLEKLGLLSVRVAQHGPNFSAKEIVLTEKGVKVAKAAQSFLETVATSMWPLPAKRRAKPQEALPRGPLVEED